MKKILLFLITCILLHINSLAQSSITIDAGAALTSEAGTDICADSKSINGSLTDMGTWCGGAWPIELEAFTAQTAGRNVKLTWQTASEVNNYGFEVERNTPLPLSRGDNATNPLLRGDERGVWEKVGFVAGNGNSNSPKTYSFTDVNAPAGLLHYRLKQIDNDGQYTYSYEVVTEVKRTPKDFALFQNYPNPCNPKTLIKYQLPFSASVTMKVFDILGNEVITLVNESKEAGDYEVEFDASHLASGIYIYTLKANEFSAINKLLLLK